MAHRTVFKFLVSFGVQSQTVYVKSRNAETGSQTIKDKMPGVVSTQCAGSSDGWGYDYDSND